MNQLSDSQFIRIQQSFQSKHQKMIETQEEEIKSVSLKKLKEKLAKNPKDKEYNMWDIITGLFK
jgi:hypothetical protein|tara:strand:- start:27 stop:218 length:192 start_codon:yes stop_codon:yes gene_type:complete